jgi:ubiquinone/menaquinone biosynthesis C-methylase UbiE
MGCLIHPAISIDKPKLRTADIATGTTVWLLDVTKPLPKDCELHGFDLSTEQFLL